MFHPPRLVSRKVKLSAFASQVRMPLRACATDTAARRDIASLGVVALVEPVEPALLRGEVALGRAGRVGLQRFVRALVAPVLLWMRRLDQLGPKPSGSV
jgi:hypothetical protein